MLYYLILPLIVVFYEVPVFFHRLCLVLWAIFKNQTAPDSIKYLPKFLIKGIIKVSARFKKSFFLFSLILKIKNQEISKFLIYFSFDLLIKDILLFTPFQMDEIKKALYKDSKTFGPKIPHFIFSGGTIETVVPSSITEAFYLKLKQSLKKDEFILFFDPNTNITWNLPEFHIYFKSETEHLSFFDSCLVWISLYKSWRIDDLSYYLKYLNLLKTEYPNSIILQLCHDQKMIPSAKRHFPSNSVLLKHTNIEDIFPNFKHRSIKKQLFYTYCLKTSFSGYSIWNYDLCEMIHELLSIKGVETSWFIRENYLPLLVANDTGNLVSTFKATKNLLKEFNSKILQRSIVESFLDAHFPTIAKFNELNQKCENKEFFFNKINGLKRKTPLNKFIKYISKSPNILLNVQDFMFLNGFKYSNKGNDYEIFVPKKNEDLILGAEALNNCVADGHFFEKIEGGELGIVFLLKNGKTHGCIELFHESGQSVYTGDILGANNLSLADFEITQLEDILESFK